MGAGAVSSSTAYSSNAAYAAPTTGSLSEYFAGGSAPDAQPTGLSAAPSDSAKWAWSCDGAGILRLSYAPDANPSRDQVLSDASLLLGRELTAVDFSVVRWPAVPRSLQPAERSRMREALPPGVHAVGAWVAGNGIEAAIASGLEAAS